MRQQKIYVTLWLLCILGSLCVLPYVQLMKIVPVDISLTQLITTTLIQSSLLFGLVLWLSSLLIPRTDLVPFRVDKPLKQIIYPGILTGLMVAITIALLDRLLFHDSLIASMQAPLWIGALASVYGAVNEEVLMRLFLFTLIYFGMGKFFKITEGNRTLILSSTACIVAIMFGLGHLPAAFQLTTPTVFEVSRILILNAVPGLALCYLYWSRGIWAAIFAHLITDLLLHGFFTIFT